MLIPLLAWMFVCGIIGSLLGVRCRKETLGFFMGAIGGPLGWIAIALLPPDPRQAAEERAAVERRLQPLAGGGPATTMRDAEEWRSFQDWVERERRSQLSAAEEQE